MQFCINPVEKKKILLYKRSFIASCRKKEHLQKKNVFSHYGKRGQQSLRSDNFVTLEMKLGISPDPIKSSFDTLLIFSTIATRPFPQLFWQPKKAIRVKVDGQSHYIKSSN